MADDDEPDDIRPGHFAAREADRGAKGALIRLFDELDDTAKQELLQFAEQLRQKKPTA